MDPKGDISSLIFLSENEEGYTHLLQLASQPIPVPYDSLEPFSSGLVVLGGGRRGQLHKLIQEGLKTQAHALHRSFVEMFGANWYIQLDEQEHKQIAEEFPDGPFAAAQYVRYLQPDERLLVQALQAVKHRRQIGDFPVHEEPLLSWAEMKRIFQDFPQALDNSVKIGERCHVQLPHHVGLPKLPQSYDLDALVWQGAARRYPEIKPEIRSRITTELQVIKEMGFTDYFLIVADIVDFAKESIPVGPGRGVLPAV